MAKLLHLGIALLGAACSAVTAKAARPNILYIFTDQQTASAMSCTGNSDLNTLNMDRLAALGVRFTNAYCAMPLSTPSRSAMFTGVSAGETSQLKNNTSIPEQYRSNTLGHIMSSVGYECGYAGKWHVPTANLPDNEFGFRTLHPHNDVGLAEACIKFLRERRKEPFFLVASFDNPHNICEYARGQKLPFATLDEPTDVADCPMLPPNFEIQPYDADVVRFEQKMVYKSYPTVNYTADQWRRYRNAYYRLVERVDAQIGAIIDELERQKLLDQTLIIFSSDHGDGAGAHRWNQKSALYEEVVNIPFIVKLPSNENAGKVCNTLVNNGIDLMPSLCHAASAPIPAYCKGADFVSYARSAGSANEPIRDYIVSETMFDKGSTQGFMVRSPRYKYIIYDKGAYREQLHDMRTDRGEMVNLALDNRYKAELERHRAMLREYVAQRKLGVTNWIK